MMAVSMKTKPSIMLERISFFASGWRAMLSLDLEMVMPIAIAPADATTPIATAAAIAIIALLSSAGCSAA